MDNHRTLGESARRFQGRVACVADAQRRNVRKERSDTSPTGVVSSKRGKGNTTRCRRHLTWSLAEWSRFSLLLCWARTFRCQVAEKTVETPPATPPSVFLETQEQMEAEPAPPPAAGSSTDGILQGRASEDRLMARMDQSRPTRTKPLSL